jgi:hypothetical protein
MVQSYISVAKKEKINVDENLSITEPRKLREKEKDKSKISFYANPSILITQKSYLNLKR